MHNKMNKKLLYKYTNKCNINTKYITLQCINFSNKSETLDNGMGETNYRYA